jgi:hypothetical protein
LVVVWDDDDDALKGEAASLPEGDVGLDGVPFAPVAATAVLLLATSGSRNADHWPPDDDVVTVVDDTVFSVESVFRTAAPAGASAVELSLRSRDVEDDNAVGSVETDGAVECTESGAADAREWLWRGRLLEGRVKLVETGGDVVDALLADSPPVISTSIPENIRLSSPAFCLEPALLSVRSSILCITLLNFPLFCRRRTKMSSLPEHMSTSCFS